MNTFDPSASIIFLVGLLIIGAVLIAAGMGVFG
jgi:hypothetical protein